MDTIRQGYQQLIDGEENSFKVNKICRVLNDFDDKKEEKVLLKEICTYATRDLEKLSFEKFLHTVNMVFPYIHREQILLWTKSRVKLQNTNPHFSSEFSNFLTSEKE